MIESTFIGFREFCLTLFRFILGTDYDYSLVNEFENNQDKIYISSEKTGAQGNLLNYFKFEDRKSYFYKKLCFTGK